MQEPRRDKYYASMAGDLRENPAQSEKSKKNSRQIHA
jgi:hypothetical protein